LPTAITCPHNCREAIVGHSSELPLKVEEVKKGRKNGTLYRNFFDFLVKIIFVNVLAIFCYTIPVI
jgi:hypothetical protein